MDRRLTVIICTHNREQLLRKCVESLLQQSVPENRFEILIVDNASRDGTAACIAEYAGKYDFIIAVHEARVGLSHARNTGLEHAAGEWIAYLDDDGTAHTDWVARLLEHVEAGEFDAVGGLYLPHFESAPPAWYLDRYNSNSWMLRKDSPVYEIRAGDPHFSGGNCAYRRAALIEIGGFSPELGMRGDRMAYSEEVELQNRLLERGYRLALIGNMTVTRIVYLTLKI